jgi:hypothetical protein
VLDVRDEPAFALGHPPGAGRLSRPEFESRRPELPSRETAVLVVHDEPALAREAAEHLAALGYASIAWLARPLSAEPTGRASCAAAERLWSPSAFIEREADRMRGAGTPFPSRPASAGAGPRVRVRGAAVFLALSGARGLGRGWLPRSSSRALFAQRQRVEVPFLEHDLGRRPFASRSAVRPDRGGALPPPPAVPWIERALAGRRALRVRDGQQRFGSPKQERFLLRDGELATAFPSLVVERHEQTPVGAPPLLARLVARKPR